MIFKILVWYFVIASGAVKIDFCFFICLSLSLSLSLALFPLPSEEYLSQGSWAKSTTLHRSLQFPMSSRSKSLLLCMVHVKCAKSSRYARTMPGSCPTTPYYSSSLKISSMDFWNIILSFFSMRKYHKYPLASETSQPSQVWSRWVSSLPKWAKWSWEMPSAPARQSPEALVPLGRHQRLIAIWWWPMFIATNNMSILYVYAYIYIYTYASLLDLFCGNIMWQVAYANVDRISQCLHARVWVCINVDTYTFFGCNFGQ